MLHGILILNKERGMTSHQVVAALRRIIHQAAIGHTGTLDPEATGVLVVGLGQATRSFPHLEETVKVYQAEIIFGRSTDTQDATGRIIAEFPATNISLDSLRSAILTLTGASEQIPPMFSAVKVGGTKLYDLARKGMVVERTARPIVVHYWKILTPQSNYGFLGRAMVEIACSKGTYIRTLIHDLGEALGCGAHMGGLVRLRSGAFCLEEALTLDEINERFAQGRLGEAIVSLNSALSHLPPLWLDEEDIKKVRNGGKLSFEKYQLPAAPGAQARVLDKSTTVLAIAELIDAGTHYFWQPVKVFHYD
jgi:tRNA pseudouridine55 synthase